MTGNERTERERVALELVNHERMVEHNLPPIEWCELTEKDQRKYLARSASAIAALRPTDSGLVERLEKVAVFLAPLGSKSGDARWKAAELMRQAATALRAQGQDERAGWQPIETAPKDRSVIWAVLRPDIYPTIEPDRRDLDRWNGLHLPLRHPGVEPDGFDMGWGVAAPVGQGGFPDAWIAGWQPLPTPPDAIEAGQHKEAGRG